MLPYFLLVFLEFKFIKLLGLILIGVPFFWGFFVGGFLRFFGGGGFLRPDESGRNGLVVFKITRSGEAFLCKSPLLCHRKTINNFKTLLR